MGYLDEKGLSHLWSKVKSALSAKQGALKGQPGQVVGFNTDGSVAAVRGWSNPNLLRNWYFRRPVNRNGLAEYTAIGYTIDGWWLNQVSRLILESDHISVETSNNNFANLFQTINNPSSLAGKTVTISALFEGDISLILGVNDTYPAQKNMSSPTPALNSITYTIADSGITNLRVFIQTTRGLSSKLYAAKLELGNQQTLAHQDEDGSWIINDPPNYDLQCALCSLYSPSTGEWVGSQHSNPNLLDNWYFVDPIDQRKGYFVPSGTKYYADSTLKTSVGTTTSDIAVPSAQDAQAITVSGNTYYVSGSDATRGYAGAVYGIDRWKGSASHVRVAVEADGLTIGRISGSTNTTTKNAIQYVENANLLAGKTVTVSALVLRADSVASLQLYGKTSSTVYFSSGNRQYPGKPFLISGIATLPEDVDALQVQLRVPGNSGDDTVTFVAAKLELGPVQTLAHQDADGNWILNDPPPNRALELAKCQRYQMIPTSYDAIYNFAIGAGTGPKNIAFFCSLPVTMRAKPEVLFENLYASNGASKLKLTKIVSYGKVGNGAWLHAAVEEGAQAGAAYYLRSEPPFTFILDANL